MKVFLGATFFIGLQLLHPAAGRSTDYIPTRYDDPPPGACSPGDCSLREAVLAANADVAADRILLSAGIYRLTIPGFETGSLTGDLNVSQDLEIVGAGATMTFLEATGLGDRVLSVILSPVFKVSRVTVRSAGLEGVLLGAGTTTIEGCVFAENGTGLSTGSGTHTIRDTTVMDNAGNGTLFGLGGIIHLENVTSSGNVQAGIFASASVSVSCRHCTLANNGTASISLATGAVFAIESSILEQPCNIAGGAVDSLGGNVERGGDTCQLDRASDQVGVPGIQLVLGDLGDHGGSTPTHVPGPTSVAINAATSCAAFDQRGVVRGPGTCEAGSVERASTVPGTPLFNDGFEQGNATAWLVGP